MEPASAAEAETVTVAPAGMHTTASADGTSSVDQLPPLPQAPSPAPPVQVVVHPLSRESAPSSSDLVSNAGAPKLLAAARGGVAVAGGRSAARSG